MKIFGKPLDGEHTLYALLKRPEIDYATLATLASPDGAPIFVPPVEPLDAALVQQIEVAAKYEGYIARQQLEIARQQSHETTRIPEGFDYTAVRGLSIEARQKLGELRPATLGEAACVSGVTPAAISLLLVFIKRWNQRGAGAATGNAFADASGDASDDTCTAATGADRAGQRAA